MKAIGLNDLIDLTWLILIHLLKNWDLTIKTSASPHDKKGRQMCGIHRDLSLLLRRFVFRMAEASAKGVTGYEPQGTMGRVQTAVVSFPPSFERTL